MIKTVIIEDEKPASRKLERMLSNFSDIEVVGKIESVEEGVAWFSENDHPSSSFQTLFWGWSVFRYL